MAKSNRLRHSDIEAVFRLVQECRDLWADADAWRQHLLRGACRLTGTAVGTYGEVGPSAEGGGQMRILHQTSLGFRDANARAYYDRFLADYADPMKFIPGLDRLVAAAARRGHGVALRQDICSDSDWYRCAAFNEYRRPAFNDGFVAALTANAQARAQETFLVFTSLNQDVADPPPTPRAAAILSLLHRQIVPLIGTELATDRQRGLHGLSPRLRQTLDALLSGASEKQIAVRLRLSPRTVHEYVAALYRHFGVDSRPQLMAYFVHRRPAAAIE